MSQATIARNVSASSGRYVAWRGRYRYDGISNIIRNQEWASLTRNWSQQGRKSGVGNNMRLRDCHNFHDFRSLAKRRLPAPIFDYIDGGADDEVTLRQNSASFDRCDLVPNVLRGVETIDLSVTVMGQKLALPVYCSPTALQRLFHHQGECAVAAAAAKYGTMFGVSSLGTVSLEELRKAHDTSQIYQFYFHKDRGLNRAMLQRAKDARVDIMMLTVDSITGGNRERDLRTG